jgi:hypothetical protein
MVIYHDFIFLYFLSYIFKIFNDFNKLITAYMNGHEGKLNTEAKEEIV